MKFINRRLEMVRLDRFAKNPEGGLAVVWGRRRVGKTRLLLEWTEKHDGIYYTADESASALQRKYFALALERALPGFSTVEYPDWTSFFNRLARETLQIGWKGPIVIDELPYLISQAPELASILQKFIDIDAKKAKLLIVLCGSSQRMMQGAILDSSAPLYGRASEIIKLGPISIGYMEEALELKNPREVVESYAIWGGVPRYWEIVNNHEGSFWHKVDSIVLDPMGPLNDEPNRLLSEEIPSASSLRPILDAIGLGAHRLSDIGARIAQPVTSLTRPIQRLIELDLIEKEVPYGCNEEHSKRTLYKMKDPFIRFWFEAVASRRSLFAQMLPSNRIKWLKEHLQPIFALNWEEICRSAIPLLSQHWGEPYFGPAGRYWHGKGAEWDIISESHDSKVILIGEAKWPLKAPTQNWINRTISETMAKGIPPIPRSPSQKVQYVLFIPEKPKNLIVPNQVTIVDAKELCSIFRLT